MIVALTLWMWALDSASRFKRVSLATGGGIFFTVGAFSYLPLVAMAFFPAFMAGWSYFRRETRRRQGLPVVGDSISGALRGGSRHDYFICRNRGFYGWF